MLVAIVLSVPRPTSRQSSSGQGRDETRPHTIPDWCHERLVEAQKKWRAKTAANQTAKETSNVESASFGTTASGVTFWNAPHWNAST